MSQPSPHVLGIDGGGTKTLAAITDLHGRVCGIGWGGPSNIDAIGVDAATASITAALYGAREQAKLEARPFASAFLGMAGVVSERDRALLRGVAASLQLSAPDYTTVDHDCRIALAGGLSGRPGIVLIAGTGSSCFGVNAAGQRWRAGGWGSLMSDEGGGYWLGREGLIASVRALDGRGPATAIHPTMLERLGVQQADDLLHRIYVTGLSHAEIAALATVVLEAARTEDAVALDVIRRGTEALSECIRAVAQHLHFGACELALVGGIFRAGELILAPLRASVHRRLPECRFVTPELPPVLGACLLGLEQLGVLDRAVVEQLGQSARPLHTTMIPDSGGFG